VSAIDKPIWRGSMQMSRRLEDMRRNPQGDWALSDVSAVCAEFEIVCAPPRGGGSHYKIVHPRMAEKLTIPSKRPIKPFYIKKLVAFIDQLRRLA
jgi:hypothetical protein